MKTTLPTRSLVAKERLDQMVAEILTVGKDKIAMIILFGSYARGDWVQDTYVEDQVTYAYQSDFDLLVVLKKNKYGGKQALDLKYKIRKKLEHLNPPPESRILVPKASLILESIDSVNKEMQRGTSFYLDIDRDGILLYDNGQFALAEANKNMTWEERRAKAYEDYNYWFKRGNGFLIDCQSPLLRNDYAIATFYLHQATESFYTAILLVFFGYKEKEHNIVILEEKAKTYSDELLKIFPQITDEQKNP